MVLELEEYTCYYSDIRLGATIIICNVVTDRCTFDKLVNDNCGAR
jgi:hypothetical protein